MPDDTHYGETPLLTRHPTTIYIVDDDQAVLKAMTRLLSLAGFNARGFDSPQAFLDDHDPRSGSCVILDLAMPERGGLDVQRELAARGSMLPIIFLTAHGDVSSSVRAMKQGAVDFLTKPVRKEDLLEAIALATSRHEQTRQQRSDKVEIEARLAKLTPRERQVMEHVVLGKSSKQIAEALGTGLQTIKVHRSRMMQKMAADSVAELVLMAEKVGIVRS